MPGGKRKRDRQRLLQQQIIGEGKIDGNDDGKNERSDDGGGDHDDNHCGKNDDSDAGNPSKRLKSHHPGDHSNSQLPSTTSPQIDAPAVKVAEHSTAITTSPAGTEINAKYGWLYRQQLGRRTGSLDLRSIEDQSSDRTAISSAAGFEVVTSYNWFNKNTILVPGGAPALIQRDLPLQIKPDKGTYYIDVNASMNIEMPFEPMFRAIDAETSPLTFHSVDLVMNRNTLRQLFELAQGKGRKDPLRVQLHLIHNTLFITRREKKNRRRMDPQNFLSFGHSFEEEFTEHAKDMVASLSHHRAIRYQFGSINLVVRHEVDAAQPAPDTLPTISEDATAVEAKLVKGIVAPPTTNHARQSGPGNKRIQMTTVLRRGTGNPTSDLVEMKARPRMGLREVIDQMWFGRTPHLVNGIHKEGKFSAINHVHCEPLFKQWEEQHQNGLLKLERLITLLRQEASVAKGHSLIVVSRRENHSVLEFWTSKFPETPLPNDLIQKFWPPKTQDTRSQASSDQMGLTPQDSEVEVRKSPVSDKSTKSDDTPKESQPQPKRRRRLPWQRV